jgi:mono/diheme cytochrome c family protein
VIHHTIATLLLLTGLCAAGMTRAGEWRPVFMVSPAAAAVQPPSRDYGSGPYLYRTLCASCHGPGGRGDGPVSDLLRSRPPDLTTIAARRGGSFPRADVHAAIDGRRLVPPHGSREMPIWGDVLRATEGQDEAVIQRRIDALVTYLESMQAK